MNALGIPEKIHEMVRALLENGWTFQVQHGMDSGGCRFLSIDARLTAGSEILRMTWHTRATDGKSYRWRSALYGQRTLGSYAKSLAMVKGDPDGGMER